MTPKRLPLRTCASVWVLLSVALWLVLVGVELAVVEWLTRPETEEVGR